MSKTPCPVCRRKRTALLVMSEQPPNRSTGKQMKCKEDNILNDSKQQLCAPCKCISQWSYIFFAVLAVKIGCENWLRGYAVVQQWKWELGDECSVSTADFMTCSCKLFRSFWRTRHLINPKQLQIYNFLMCCTLNDSFYFMTWKLYLVVKPKYGVATPWYPKQLEMEAKPICDY